MDPSPRSRVRHGALLAALAGALALPACVQHHPPARPPDAVVYAPGPPPHARAHGWRRAHRPEVEMVFDDALGVYVVVGRSHHYHDGDRYLRWYRGGWQASAELGGTWVWIRSGDVPPALHAHTRKALALDRRGHAPPAKADY